MADEKRITASGGKAGEGFGASVAISGDIAVVSAPRGDGARTEQGAAHIFERDRGGANNWGEVKKLTASDGQSGDEFGRSVAINGDTIVVGASVHQVGENEDQGAAYVFERNRGGADNWGEVKKLIAPNGEPDDFFGGSVAISNDIVVVGAAFHKTGENQNQGAAYVFERNEGGADNWGAVAQLISSDVGNDLFGLSVAIHDETVVVGASSADGAASDQGAAYVFERNQGGANKWGQSKKLTASDGRSRDQYGVSVSISVDTVVVGANVNDAGQNEDQGAAYIYERDLGGADNWGEVKKLIASDGQAEDFFGDSVAIMVNTIIIGAPNKPVEDSEFQGAAYVFERDRGGADNWGEANRLTASDGASEDLFGNSVAISKETALVGSSRSDVGKNLDQGSAYIFMLNAAPVIIPVSATIRKGIPSEEIIATVSDDRTPAGGLIVEVVTTPAGISLSGFDNQNGTFTAVISADGSAALGENFVGLKVTDSNGESATANLTIKVTADDNAPTIRCPSAVLAVAARPGDASVVIEYEQPIVNDDSPAPSVVCSPPSGSSFPVGLTTVTCTATDVSGNTAQCSFPVRIFDACIQDDANTNAVLLFNTFTGDYFFCFNGTLRSGQGSVTSKGSTFLLVHNTSDRRVEGTLDASQNRGTASLQSPPGSVAITITDRDIRNNACNCFLI